MSAASKASVRLFEFPGIEKLPVGSSEIGFTAEWLPDECVVVYSLQQMGRKAVDYGLDAVLKWMAAWPKGQLYAGVYKFRVPTIALSPHLQSGLRSLRTAHPEVRGFSAAVIPQGIINQMLRLFMHAKVQSVRPLQMFNTMDDALGWLRIMRSHYHAREDQVVAAGRK